jgi:hypothetical protein
MRQSEKIQWNQTLSALLKERDERKILQNQALAGFTETAF